MNRCYRSALNLGCVLRLIAPLGSLDSALSQKDRFDGSGGPG